MSTFICEKCGNVDNSATNNNYWHVFRNKRRLSDGYLIEQLYQSEFEYFETHYCCEKCCDGVVFEDGRSALHSSESIQLKHWSNYGNKNKLLHDARCIQGDLVNAEEYFAEHN